MVRGYVQGVGFRYFVLGRGREAGLRGWVRNRPDGAVECVAEGPRQQLEWLLAELHRGPRLARVSEVETEWQPPRGDVDDFDVTP